jgi:hypothetical protein
MSRNFDKFYQAYMTFYGAEEGDRESLLEALETHDYSKVHPIMLTAYALWGEATHSADVCSHITAKRNWIGLTDGDIKNVWDEMKDAVCLDHKTFAHAISELLKEKNT